jgi:hypothetical protein
MIFSGFDKAKAYVLQDLGALTSLPVTGIKYAMSE